MKKRYFLGVLLSLLLMCSAGAADTGQPGNEAAGGGSASEAAAEEDSEAGGPEAEGEETEIPEEEVPLADVPGVHTGLVIAGVAVIVMVSLFGTGGVLLTAASGSAISVGGNVFADEWENEEDPKK